MEKLTFFTLAVDENTRVERQYIRPRISLYFVEKFVERKRVERVERQ